MLGVEPRALSRGKHALNHWATYSAQIWLTVFLPSFLSGSSYLKEWYTYLGSVPSPISKNKSIFTVRFFHLEHSSCSELWFLYLVKPRVGTGSDTEAPVVREDLRPCVTLWGLGRDHTARPCWVTGKWVLSWSLHPHWVQKREQGILSGQGCVLIGDTVSPALVTYWPLATWDVFSYGHLTWMLLDRGNQRIGLWSGTFKHWPKEPLIPEISQKRKGRASREPWNSGWSSWVMWGDLEKGPLMKVRIDQQSAFLCQHKKGPTFNVSKGIKKQVGCTRKKKKKSKWRIW